MTPWVRRLLIANVVVYISMGLMPPEVLNQLVLVPALAPLRPWTVITYQFLHAGLLHLLFNMIALFFFGPRLELRVGSRHFIFLYLLSGVAGAALSVFTPTVAIVGASGAVFGVLLGFARYWPREKIWIWAVFPVEARILVIVLAAMSIMGGISGAGNVAHLAHLGGFVGGWAYLKILERRSPARKFRKQVEAVTAPSVSGRDLARWREVDSSALHPLNREEFERVLGKAEKHGVPSLSAQERAFMERIAQR
jgi:membrane associated rhomboid family serine protease